LLSLNSEHQLIILWVTTTCKVSKYCKLLTA